MTTIRSPFVALLAALVGTSLVDARGIASDIALHRAKDVGPPDPMASGLVAGFVETFPWRRFLLFDALAGTIWGVYTVLLGYFGGKTFEDAPWKGLLLAFTVALAVTAAVEAVRHLRRRPRVR